MIPVPDLLGRIQAYQVRYDDAASDGRRYAWYSSRGMPGGSSPGVPAAVWQPELIASAPIWITEGSLKAAVAARHLHGCVIGVSGVSNWRGAVELLPAKTPVVIAFDADALTNRTVAHHRTSLARALFWAGHPVAIATWDRRFKGIDDALASGATIEQHTWPIGQVLNRNGTTVRLLVPEKPANAVRLSEYIR